MASADQPLVDPWLELPAAAYLASWTGAAFDLSIVPLLLWRRTRAPAFVALVGFHAATAALFNIGVFPYIMTAGATLFLSPYWPRRLGLDVAWARPHARRNVQARRLGIPWRCSSRCLNGRRVWRENTDKGAAILELFIQPSFASASSVLVLSPMRGKVLVRLFSCASALRSVMASVTSTTL